jgi:uncharacterized cupin superfamily protein
MSKIIVEHHPSQQRLDQLGIKKCPTWSKEPSTFSWSYSEREIAYIIEGEVTVTPEGGEPVSFSAGDLVTFEPGLKCTWHVKKKLKKYYLFE